MDNQFALGHCTRQLNQVDIGVSLGKNLDTSHVASKANLVLAFSFRNTTYVKSFVSHLLLSTSKVENLGYCL
jgi:hypothetical protein